MKEPLTASPRDAERDALKAAQTASTKASQMAPRMDAAKAARRDLPKESLTASQTDAEKDAPRAPLMALQMVPRKASQWGVLTAAPKAASKVARRAVQRAAPKGTQTESCSAGSSAASPRHTSRSVLRWIRNRRGPEHTTGMHPASSRQQRTTGSLKYQGTSTGQQDTPNRTPRRPPTLCPWGTHSQS